MSVPERFYLVETTLREGEQSPGATLTSKEKLEIAKKLSQLGERTRWDCAGLAPLFVALAVPDAALRGVLHRLGEGLGVIAADDAPLTVKSFDTTAASRPSMRPNPATLPSAGVMPHSPGLFDVA